MEKVEAQKALAVVERAEQSERAARGISATTAPGARPAGKMWVDRYRPRRFADLLGDERVHREVMAWLKEWDLCVFKRRPKRAREAAKADKFAATPGAPGQPAPWADPYGRPSERVMLISGPPGLGKTTLAHVVAAQAGYGVFELNASDARTASAVEDQVRMALESASMKDSRPTLVVVDEIDGATGGGSGEGGGGGFVKALVKLIEGGKGFRKKGKKGKGSKPLLRPIICICNDL